MRTTERPQPIRLTRRGERVKNILLAVLLGGVMLLTGLAEEVPESNPPFGNSSAESEAK